MKVWDIADAEMTHFVYDADGQRVGTVKPNRDRIYYPFPAYEEEVRATATIQRRSYWLGGQLIALQNTGDPTASNNGIFYIHSDHLGSVTILSHSSGSQVVGEETRYYPYGGWRLSQDPNAAPDGGELMGWSHQTDRDFTGHRRDNWVGLIYMNARYYSTSFQRFISADSLVPDPTDPQSFNRYSYTRNNPLNRVDPTGHADAACVLGECGFKGTTWLMYWAPPTPEETARANQAFTNALVWAPVVETVDDALTSGCGLSCQAGYEEPVGWGWRAVSGVALLAPVSGKQIRAGVDLLDDTLGFATRSLADLQFWNRVTEFNRVRVYQRNDLINPDLVVTWRGQDITNLELMRKGYAPVGPDGKRIELHHMLQTDNSPIAEVASSWHSGHYDTIHFWSRSSGRGGEISRSAFNSWKRYYWMNRAKDFGH